MKTLNIKQVGRAKQAGFTIIELVVVILLLGILTATALPRFLDISDQAHDAVVDATFGSLSSALALYRAGWFAQGQPTASAVTYGGATVLFTDDASGYPAGDDNDNVIDSEADCLAVFDNLLQITGGNSVRAVVAGNTGHPTASGSGKAGDATNTIGAEFVAVYVNTGSADDLCEYYYVAQFSVSAGTVSVPYLLYDPTTGALTAPTEVDLIAVGA